MSLPDITASVGELARTAAGPLLAVDVATATGSIALATATACYEQTLTSSAMPSDSLASALDAMLRDAGSTPSQLAAIVVGLGPGSFTGLRVALATVKGLAYGAGVPVYGVSSLALVAAGSGVGLVAPVFDARRGEVFCALYETGADAVPRLLIDDAARPPAAFVELLSQPQLAHAQIVSDGTAAANEVAVARGQAITIALPPRAAVGLLLAGPRIRAHQADPLSALSPRYLRVSEAERVLQAQRR